MKIKRNNVGKIQVCVIFMFHCHLEVLKTSSMKWSALERFYLSAVIVTNKKIMSNGLLDISSVGHELKWLAGQLLAIHPLLLVRKHLLNE